MKYGVAAPMLRREIKASFLQSSLFLLMPHHNSASNQLQTSFKFNNSIQHSNIYNHNNRRKLNNQTIFPFRYLQSQQTKGFKQSSHLEYELSHDDNWNLGLWIVCCCEIRRRITKILAYVNLKIKKLFHKSGFYRDFN